MICHSAIEAKLGVRIATPDALAFRSQFYSFRNSQRKRGETLFDSLTCHIASPSEVWLIKGAPDAEDR